MLHTSDYQSGPPNDINSTVLTLVIVKVFGMMTLIVSCSMHVRSNKSSR